MTILYFLLWSLSGIFSAMQLERWRGNPVSTWGGAEFLVFLTVGGLGGFAVVLIALMGLISQLLVYLFNPSFGFMKMLTKELW